MIDKDLYIQFLEQLVKNSFSPVVLKSVKTRNRKPSHKWSAADKERLLRLHSEGIKVAEIARIMGLRRQQVDNQIYSLMRRNKVA
jgi:DNA-binding CsgD family transcriptional regulator